MELEIKKFNETALEFLTKMELSFPHEKKISSYKIMFIGLKAINYKDPVKIFMINMEPYGVQIMSRNEHFFKDDQFVDSAENLSGQLGLTEYWDNLPVITKDAIWNYIQMLYVLGMQCIDKKAELQKIINNL
jgi:hypothetical protein